VIAPRTVDRRRCRPGVEQLEPRTAPVGLSPSAVETLYLERLNDARANPAAYGASIGLNLFGVAPAPPLAFDLTLVFVARLHSQDESNRGYFGHVTPEGLGPTQRVALAGLHFRNVEESISAGGGGTMFVLDQSGPHRVSVVFPFTPDDSLADLIIDPNTPGLGHRVHLLALDSTSRAQRLVGIGFVTGDGPLANYYTIDTIAPVGKDAFITGAVFRDSNGNGRYDLGEGLGGVQLQFRQGGKLVGTIATWDAGGYSFRAKPGTYQVTARGGSLPAPVTEAVRVGTDNARLDFIIH
jgi:hypothetical protein